MAMEDPIALLARLKLGREEFCQRLLTMLILDDAYPRWNTRSAPSPAGTRFLRELDALSFGAAGADPEVFVDEFDMPRRHESERGCAPDYAVLWDDRLWMVELKTEKASHRPAQIPGYFELAQHYYPDRRIDLTYLTPAMPLSPPPLRERSRFSHVTWEQVAELIRQVWADGDEPQRRAVEALTDVLDGVGSSWPAWRETRLAVTDLERDAAAHPQVDLPTAQAEALALALAQATSRDGSQRALDRPFANLEELQGLRLSVREAIRAEPEGTPIRHVLPWLWDATSSGGKALTANGEQTGYELRLSRYMSPVC